MGWWRSRFRWSSRCWAWWADRMRCESGRGAGTGGQQHFQVGERGLFFLHAPNAAGLSSAVDGTIGSVPVVPMGANGKALLDVRWLATRVRRAAGVPLEGASEGGIALADGVAVTKGWRTGGGWRSRRAFDCRGMAAASTSRVGSSAPGASVAQEQRARVGAVWVKESDDVQR